MNPFLHLVPQDDAEDTNPFLHLVPSEPAPPEPSPPEPPSPEPIASAEPPLASAPRSRSRGGAGGQQPVFQGAEILSPIKAFGSGLAGDTSFHPPEQVSELDAALRSGTPTIEQILAASEHYASDDRSRARLDAEQRQELRRWVEASQSGSLEGLGPSSGFLPETSDRAYAVGRTIGSAWESLGAPFSGVETAAPIVQGLMARPHRMFERERSFLPQFREAPEREPTVPVDTQRIREEQLRADPFFQRTDRPLILDLLDRDDREDAYNELLKDKRSASGWARTIARAPAEGAAGVAGSTIQGASIDIERTRQDLGFQPRAVEESPWYKTGENIIEIGRKLADIREEYRDHLATDAAIGFGSLAGFAGIGLLGRGAGGAYSKATGNPLSKAGEAGFTYGPSVGMAQSSGVAQAYENVQEFRKMYPELAAEMGIDDNWAINFATGYEPRLYGAVQVASIVSLLRPLTGTLRQQTVRRMIETGFNEFTVENLGQWGQNILRQRYDEDHPLWQDVPYSGAAAGIGSMFLALLMSPVTRGRGTAGTPGYSDPALESLRTALDDAGVDLSVLYESEAGADPETALFQNLATRFGDASFDRDQVRGQTAAAQPYTQQIDFDEIARDARQELSRQQLDEGGLEGVVDQQTPIGEQQAPLSPVSEQQQPVPDGSLSEAQRQEILDTARNLDVGDVVRTELDGDIVVKEVVRNKDGSVNSYGVEWAGKSIEAFPDKSRDGFIDISTFLTPQPYIDANTGERKFGQPAVVVRGESAAPAQPTAPSAFTPTHTLPDGTPVRFTGQRDTYELEDGRKKISGMAVPIGDADPAGVAEPVEAPAPRSAPEGMIGMAKTNAPFQNDKSAWLALKRKDLQGQALEPVQTEQGWFLQPIDPSRTDIPEVGPVTIPFERPALIEQFGEELLRAAPDAGWAEEGGRAMRAEDGDFEGEVVGVTNWIASAEWFNKDSFASDARIPERADRIFAVQKAIDGEPMSPTERRFVYSLIEVAQEYVAAEEAALQSLEAVDAVDPTAIDDIPGLDSWVDREELSNEEADALFGVSTGDAEGSGGTQEATPAGAPQGTQEVPGQAQDPFDLTGQTPSEARSEAESIARAEAEQAAREQAEQERAEADSLVDSFDLTRPGQERDIPGQMDIFSQRGEPPQAQRSEPTQPESTEAESLSSQLAAMSDADLDAMMDDIEASTPIVETSKPKAKRKSSAKVGGKKRPRKVKSTAESGNADRAISEIQSSLGENLSSAGQNAMRGLVEMFGTRGKLSSGLTFDEDSYAKAKPYFQAMLRDFQEAGKDVRALVQALMETLGDGARPYIKRFAQDLREEATIEGQEVQDGVQGSVPDGDAGTSAETVSGVADEGADGRALATEERGSAQDAGRTDEGRAETPERGSESPVSDTGRADRSGDADRVPARVAENFRIERGALREERGRVQKAKDNIRAIELVRELEAEGRPATREEQAQLALYTGWGGLKDAFPDGSGKFGKGMETIGPRLQELLTETEYSTARRSIQYAHYTAENVIDAMWQMAERLGFKGGKVFEPGMGVGHFAGLMPADIADSTQYSGVELDHMTARIAKLLYPKWGVRQDDFTRSPLPPNTFDVAIGNVPFADVAVRSDPLYAKHGFLLHDYFMAKSLDGIRPGGVMLFVTSAGTMNKIDSAAREYIADQADLVGAVRLPGNAFEKSAGTKVTTDILVFRKRLPDEAAGDRSWTETTNVTLPNKHGRQVTGAVNRYFADNPDMVLGEQGFFDPLYEDRYGVRAREGDNLDSLLRQAIGRLPENILSEWVDTTGRAEVDFGTTERKEGSFYIGKDGQLMQQQSGVGVKVERRGKGVKGGRTQGEMDRIRMLVPIRDALRAVYAADLSGDAENATKARKRLNRSYDAFVAEYGPINKAEFLYRRPTVIQQESARAAAREEARYAGTPWNEGDFDPSSMNQEKATLSQIAAARKAAREEAEAAGRTFDEGSFNPADMEDVVLEKRANIAPFMDDPESYRLRAIERYNDQTGEAKKGDIFFENVISRETQPQINSVHDALLYVLNQSGRLDIERVAQETGVGVQQAIDELGETIFLQPGTDTQWVTRDEYLSGNVRQKLRMASAAAERDPRFRRNVEALEAVQPAPLPPSEINANLGMPWIPTETIEAFGKELGLETVTVQYTPKLAQWVVRGDTGSAASTATWGTSDVPATTLMQDALNRQTPKVYREYRVDGETVRELDQEATQAAQDKLLAMKERFNEWVWEDPARAEDLAALYNEEYNNLVVREFNGDYLTTPGISSGWSWRPHQKRVIARIIQAGNTYMGHGVGAGKTSAMIGSGMEMRRLGLVRKPMYVVPNHMLGQFTKEFYEQYPTARIMVADERRFHTHRRKQFVADVANEDLDAVIITHSGFGMIPVSESFQDGLIQQQIDEYRQLLNEMDKDQENRITRSRMEKQIERLEQRLSGRGKRTDQVFTFEEMGVDFLFVDEAHQFRKLDFATKMSNVKGIDPSGSKSSWDLFVKTRYLETINPGRNLVLASGTPITNTMAELYSLSRYLQPDALRERGLEHFDAWAGAFGDTKTQLEQDPAGGYKAVTRFAKFVNVPELSNMVRQIMDVVTGKQLSQYVTRPTIKGGKRQMNLAESSDALSDYQLHLATRMQAIENRRGPAKKGDDILLNVIGDGRHAAIDMRLVDSNLKDDPGSKLNLLVDNVHRIWKETRSQPLHEAGPDGYSAKPVDKGPAAQMVFANLGLSGKRGFSVPDFIRSELNRRGVPRSQIAYIADFKSHVDKQRLFNDMNEGKVRILIGSTAKMGTGVNAQRRLYALHNLDPLWFPADDEQRIGRALRQGNMNPEIEIHDYSTKGTYDSTMWGMMETKSRFIEAFFEGDPALRDMEDLGEASQYEQAKAITTSDPRMIELTELKQELERARRRKSAHDREQAAVKQKLEGAHRNKEIFTRRIADIQKDIARRQDTSGESFRATIDGKSFTDRLEAGDMLLGRLDIMKGEARDYRDHKVGEIGGFDIIAEVWGSKDRFASVALGLEGGYRADIRVSGSARGVIQSLEAGLKGFESNLEYAREKVAKADKDIKQFDGQQNKPFTGQAKIDELAEKVRKLEGELAPEPETPAESRGAEGGALTVQEATQGLSEVTGSLSVPVTVHASPAEASRATGLDIPNDANGLYWRDEIHLIASAHQSVADAEGTLWHEIKHAGVSRLYKRDAAGYHRAMNQIALRNRNIAEAAMVWRKQFGEDFRKTLRKAGMPQNQIERAVRSRSIEEALADLSKAHGRDIKLKGLRQFINDIVQWMRERGFTRLPDLIERLTDAEALEMVVAAREAVTAGEATVFTGTPAAFSVSEADGSQRQTETKAFREWFGESKVVDDQGRPMVVYHGTSADADFSKFKVGSRGAWFSSSQEVASEYASDNDNQGARYNPDSRRHERTNTASRVMPVYLKIENPYRLTQEDARRVNVENYAKAQRELFAEIRAKGFDGILWNDGLNKEWVALESPTQVKSAVGNQGTFDAADPDILYSRTDPDSAVGRQERGITSWVKNGQPLDRMFKFLFDATGQVDSAGRWKAGTKLESGVKKALTEWKPNPDGVFGWINPALDHARAGLIDRYGLSQEFVQREFEAQAEEATILGMAETFLKKLKDANVGHQESKVLQQILTGEDPGSAEMQRLAAPIREAIDELGMQLVELGLLPREDYHRHLGKYLHRSYMKYETRDEGLPQWARKVMNKRRRSIYGDELKARGLKEDVTTERLLRDLPPDWWGRKLSPKKADERLVNTEWKILDLVKTPGEGSGALEGIDPGTPKKRTVRRVFWPADMPVPDRMAEYTDRGTWKITGTHKNKLRMRRDFTKEERESMGEILDARYNIIKTFQLLSHDIANGRFFKDIAQNDEWAVKEIEQGQTVADPLQSRRLRTFAEVDWVKVPKVKIQGTGAHKWGALAGMYVRPEIWRDLNEMDKMQSAGTWRTILNQWKINKTARSPVVHMNNVMSNFVLMDLIDVRLQDLTRGIAEYRNKGEMWQEARDHGAFGAGFVRKELQRNMVDPILDELLKEARNTRDTVEGRTHLLSKLGYGLWGGIKAADRKMVDFYQVEDELFRMATFMRHRSMGASPTEAAQIARDQFLNYDIRAPWVNAARASVLPFISYTYRAVPAIAQAIMHRPWKLAKYITIGYLANLMAFELAPGDEDEERRTMRGPLQGMTWASIPFTDIGVHRMIRMPWRDQHDNPVYLDVWRWVPAGDVFDTNQGQLGIPAWLQFGGPMQLGFELTLNRSAFTGSDIVDRDTDTGMQAAGKRMDYLWKAWMPSAAYIPGSWHFDKAASAFRDERDMLGRPYSRTTALLSGVGVKVQPHDVQLGYYFRSSELQRKRNAIRSEMRQITLDAARNIGSESSRARDMARAEEKLRRLEEEIRQLIGE